MLSVRDVACFLVRGTGRRGHWTKAIAMPSRNSSVVQSHALQLMLPLDPNRLQQQIAFVLEADKLKSLLRRTPIADNSRLENSAEHSWHLALAAMALEEDAPAGTDLPRAVRVVVAPH